MRYIHNDEKGLAVVEATILLPFCFVMVISVFYASIFLCQKANLQANVENALVYYKNVESDTYVVAKTQMDFSNSGQTISANGSNYSKPVELFPYRFAGMRFNESGFSSFFKSICGYMFFDNGNNVELVVKSKNYVAYKEITATARQTVKPPISFNIIGIKDNTMEIVATGKAVVNDTDDFIRNVDFVVDITEDTELGKNIKELAGKVQSSYDKFKKKFGV